MASPADFKVRGVRAVFRLHPACELLNLIALAPATVAQAQTL